MKSVEVTNVVKKSLVMLVVIDRSTNRVDSQGSEVVINEEGIIITAYHVVNLALNDKSKLIWAIPYT